eukprot:TRINITY_DN26388_c0_g1_i1.p1 TRINITY_DN26388_c0_g1~~TRINITY_DN26388_c0_g1_i1.p1  ORF type:complete len:750 (-),score=108.20 TRINITY_DN26388_c0_g1_i1:142-2391(-)
MPRPMEVPAEQQQQQQREEQQPQNFRFRKHINKCLDQLCEDLVKIHQRDLEKYCFEFGGELRMENHHLQRRIQELEETGGCSSGETKTLDQDKHDSQASNDSFDGNDMRKGSQVRNDAPNNIGHSWLADISFEEERKLNLALLPCPERWLLLADRAAYDDMNPTQKNWNLRSMWVRRHCESGHRNISENFNRIAQLAHQFTRVASVGDVIGSNSRIAPFMVNPHSSFRFIWNILSMLCIVWDMIVIPLQASDLGSLVPFADNVGIAAFIFWCVDLPLNFTVGIDNGVGVIDMRPRHIFNHYITTWFAMDISLILIDVFLFSTEAIMSGVTNSIQTMRIARALRLIRFLRLMRLHKSTEFVDVLLSRVRSEYTVLTAKLISLTLKVVVVVHYIACLWYLISTIDEEDNWRTPYELDEKDKWYAYVLAVHWSLSQFSPATQNIAPRNFYERTFSIFIVFYAFLAFSSFLSSMTKAVNELSAINVENSRGQAAIRKFFCNKKVSTDLWCRITMFCRVKNLHDRVLKETEIPTFEEIPESLRIKLHEELYMPFLEGARFMEGRDDTDTQLMSKICHYAITEERQGPRQDIFVEGMESNSIIAFFEGEAKYWSACLDQPICLHNAAITPSKRRRSIYHKHIVKGVTYLCEFALWTRWHHRGQLITGASSAWMEFHCETFAAIVAKEAAGHLYSYLKTVGLLVLAQAEADEKNEITDLGLSDSVMRELTDRANAFSQLQQKSGSIAGMFSMSTEF